MAVVITFSETNGGSAMTLGDLGSGGEADGAQSPVTVYMQHDGSESITDAKIFFSSSDDAWDEIVSWGEQAPVDTYGLQVNFNAAGGFPDGSWLSVTSSQLSSIDNAVTVPTTAGLDEAGEIPAGDAPNVRFQVRIVFPDSIDDTTDLGTKGLKLNCKYTYTS